MGGIYILSMQCLSILWDSHSPVWRTQTNMFMILLPRTPAIPFLFFFFFFAFKTDGKIFLLLYPFFYLLFFINIFNQQQFSLTATILGCESRSMELFLGMHVQSDDHQKRVQQLVDSRAQHFVDVGFQLFFSEVIIFFNLLTFFQDTYNIWLKKDMETILQPIWISIQICGWRQDCPVEPIKIRCMVSLTL